MQILCQFSCTECGNSPGKYGTFMMRHCCRVALVAIILHAKSYAVGALHPLLVVHSLLRWLVLASLLYAIVNAFIKWRSGAPFHKSDNIARVLAVIIGHTQLVIGLALYFISPIVSYFWPNFSLAVHQRQVRFFGMEHIFVMLTAITVLTIGSAKAKRKPTGAQKHKTIFIWFTIALVLILSSIPWAFSPLVSRPWVRW